MHARPWFFPTVHVRSCERSTSRYNEDKPVRVSQQHAALSVTSTVGVDMLSLPASWCLREGECLEPRQYKAQSSISGFATVDVA